MRTMQDMVDRAFALGYQAAERHESRAPALNTEFMEMMQANRGVDWTLPLQAYSRGFNARLQMGDDGKPRGQGG